MFYSRYRKPLNGRDVSGRARPIQWNDLSASGDAKLLSSLDRLRAAAAARGERVDRGIRQHASFDRSTAQARDITNEAPERMLREQGRCRVRSWRRPS